MAPEMLAGQKYNGSKVDMFALGVLMFILIARREPFQLANERDEIYKLILEGDHSAFWQYHTHISP